MYRRIPHAWHQCVESVRRMPGRVDINQQPDDMMQLRICLGLAVRPK
jgi:hypothetical protein